jgi:potassium-transporting ATPase KdpC subunit
MLRELAASFRMLLVLTLLTGVAYPLAVTGIARVVLPRQAGGSLIVEHGRVTGSELIGQSFADSTRFWSRPSATTVPYDPSGSSGSNLGPTNVALTTAIAARVQALRAADPGNAEPVPSDLATASASGLDPDLSPAGAAWQVRRVARARGLDPARVQALVDRLTVPPLLGVVGGARVNVRALNDALEALSPRDRRGM